MQSAMVRGLGRPEAGRGICAVDRNRLIVVPGGQKAKENTWISHNWKGNS